MAIFSNNKIEEYVSDVVACEGYDVDLGGCYDAIMESYDDEQAVIEAFHAFDMAELEAMKESGTANVMATPIMEASLKETWAKIKEWFKKMFARIMAFFKSCMDYLNSLMMSGKSFANKYKDRLNKLNLSGFSYEMYNYQLEKHFSADIKELNEYAGDLELSTESIASDHGYTNDNVNEYFTKLKQKFDDDAEKGLEELRLKLAGDRDPEKFTSALYKKFRGGDTKKSVSVTNLQPYVSFLLSSDKSAYVKKTNDIIKSKFSKMEQSINKAASEAEKVKEGENATAAAKKAALMRNALSYNSTYQSYLTRYVNAWAAAVKEATGVYKNLCFKAMSYKSK